MGDNVQASTSSLCQENIGTIATTDILQQKAADIRQNKPDWQSYNQSQTISDEDFQCILALESEEKVQYLDENALQCARTFLSLLSHVSNDEIIHYVLVMVDDISEREDEDDRSRVTIFHDYAAKCNESIWGAFLNLLYSQDEFIVNMSARILAKLACWGRELMPESVLNPYMQLLKDQLTIKHNEYLPSVARCLQMMLRVDEYRLAFGSVDGISTIIDILSSKVNSKVQYQLIFCLWVLTFNRLLAESMNKFNAIPILADILIDTAQEKVTRVILALFRNLIEKPDEPQITKEHCIAMIRWKVLRQLNILEQRRFNDEDITNEVKYLTENLQNVVQNLCSFDEYSIEVKSGRLEWSPVHKSAKFWRENAHRLNERNHKLLKLLVRYLATSRDSLVLSVACFDIGEYVRHSPRGKDVIERLGGKELVMKLLDHEDPNVQYEALLAVQKLMVINWSQSYKLEVDHLRKLLQPKRRFRE